MLKLNLAALGAAALLALALRRRWRSPATSPGPDVDALRRRMATARTELLER
jgi:hypothetical protein